MANSLTPGTLYFIPVTLGGDRLDNVLPADVIQITQNLEVFVVENEKTARHFLSLIKPKKPIRELTLLTLNEHTETRAIPALLNPLLAGQDVGVMSESGCPGVADPGAQLAALAHQKNIRVAPLVGPSSILLSLMASGLNGQHFTFLGYLPADKSARLARLKEIEKQSQKNNETQVFIETPYRNQHLLVDILANCQPETRLCVACNVSTENEFIVTRSIKTWKQQAIPDLHKKPTVFLLLA